MCARAAESGLHFIGNADAAGRANVLVDMLEIIIGEDDTAPDALN